MAPRNVDVPLELGYIPSRLSDYIESCFTREVRERDASIMNPLIKEPQAETMNAETLTFQLIHNPDFFKGGYDELSTRETVRCLIRALDGTDKQVSDKIETLLSRVGEPVIPELIRALKSPSQAQRSTCAMILIRIGQPAVNAIQTFALQHAHREEITWITDFILDELGTSTVETLPEATSFAAIQEEGLERQLVQLAS